MHVRAARSRFKMPKDHALEIASAFFAASRSGDLQGLRSLLAADVTIYTDGGGNKPAALRPIVGLRKVMAAHKALQAVFAEAMSRMVRYGFINGLPGFVTVELGQTLQTTALDLGKDGLISAIYIVRNPKKLEHVEGDHLH
jgi:RNA polymerase sigma-70 factor (ECF subfamily)